jgi:ureidoglycolate hydrolase
MSDVIEIRLERLRADAFAPFGQLICARTDEPPIFAAPHLRSWRQDFEVLGPPELMYIHYRHQPIEFSAFERHFQVTQTFVALGGAASVMVVGPPPGWRACPSPVPCAPSSCPARLG